MAAGRGRSGGPRRRQPGASGGPPGHIERKRAQLAAQIGRSIEATLVGECEDEVLQNISVESVKPASGNRMLVTLIVHPPGTELGREDVLARLEAQRNLIVDRIAQDVTRRALPELSFWVVRDPGATNDDDDGPQGDAVDEGRGPDDPDAWGYDPFT